VEVDNQFGRQDLTVTGPIALAVPTQKLSPGNHGSPAGLDHFLLYQVTEGPNVNVVVDLNDQFGYEPNISVTRPRFFANPVQKTHDGDTIFPIQNPDEHLVFYDISGAYQTTSVSVINQFGQPTFDTYEPALLAVPSDKISFEQPEPGPLDHFKCYWTGEDMVIGQNVYLEDQFGTWEVVVDESWYLCNPVEKTHGQMETQVSNYDHHLMIYSITPQPDYWHVQVSNQFGTYQVTLQGPVALAVPTQKLEPGSHGPPVGLDHFLLYEVVPPAPAVNQIVDLNDQFGFEPDVLVTDLVFFANPVRKTDATGVVTEIQNPDDHLLFCAVEDDTHS
jgi:hypothetical protein